MDLSALQVPIRRVVAILFALSLTAQEVNCLFESETEKVGPVDMETVRH